MGTKSNSFTLTFSEKALAYRIYVIALFLMILVGLLGRFVYDLVGMVSNCGAGGYTDESYLARCDSDFYGDYDTRAFLYDLEPVAVQNAKNSRVVFSGNSRIQFAFSTNAVRDYFSRIGVKHYVFGFGDSREAFLKTVIEKMALKPELLIVQTDSWYFGWLGDREPFRPNKLPPAAPASIRFKKLKQMAHRQICSNATFVNYFGGCPDKNVLFRNRISGEWDFKSITKNRRIYPIDFDYEVDDELLKRQKIYATEFMKAVKVPRNCIVFTSVPWPLEKVGTGRALAEYLGVRFVLPKVIGLKTFDGSHLDEESAELFSKAFLRELEPIMRECVTGIR